MLTLIATEVVRADFGVSIVVSLVMSAILVVLSEVLRPKPKLEDARPAGLGDFQFPTAIEGRPVPVLIGTCKLKGPNVVWYGALQQVPIKERIKTGLWSKKTIVKGYQYHVGVQLGLCRGQIDAVTKVWIGDTEVWSGSVQDGTIAVNKPALFGGDDFGNGGMVGDFEVHSGSETQAADTYLATYQSPLPAYRGTAYVVWKGGYVGNSTTIKPWAFEVQRFPNGLALTGGKEKVNTYDANPVNWIYELITDDDWGLGLPAADVNVANFTTTANTLYDEGNGISMIVDQHMDAADLLKEIERQIDGVVYIDQQTGKFEITLARGGYDIDTVPQITSSNIVEVREYSPGTWEGTVNQLRVGFTDRLRDYFATFAQASNMANLRIQGNELVSVAQQYPGVKDKDLASQIASREIRQLSRPLSKATIVVDRTLWETHPGDVLAWTDDNLSLTKLPVRVARIDFGQLTDGRIELGVVEDVFSYDTSFEGSPQSPGWSAPTQDVGAIPANEQKVFEAPYALTRRDPEYPGVGDRIWAGARAQTGSEIHFATYQRNAVGTPAGSYTNSGETAGFLLIGELRTALTAGDANPTTTVQLDAITDTLAEMQNAFTASPSAMDMGQNLVNLVMVGDEFMAVTSVVNQSTHLDLGTVYRGMLDSIPADHAVNDRVYLLFVSGGLTDDTIAQTNNVDVQLRAQSRTDETTEGEATVVQLTMANRVRLPYPPVELELNGTRYDDPVDFDDLKSGGSTLDERGVELEYLRRDWRTFDEVAGLTTDAGTLSTDFPTFNDTKYRAKIIDDPDGSPSDLFETAWNSGDADIFMSRTRILRETAGVIPTTLKVEVRTQHTYETTAYEALYKLNWTFDLDTSTLDDDHNWGNVPFGTVTGTWTAPVTGTYTFNIGTSMPSGNIQARINGGSWQNVVLAGNLTGTLAGVTVSDTIETQHLSNTGTSNETFLEAVAPSGTVDAYAVMIY